MGTREKPDPGPADLPEWAPDHLGLQIHGFASGGMNHLYRLLNYSSERSADFLNLLLWGGGREMKHFVSKNEYGFDEPVRGLTPKEKSDLRQVADGIRNKRVEYLA